MATDPSSSLPASHAEAAERSWLAARLAAADTAAVRWSARTGEVLVWLLAANIVLAAAGVGFGLLLFDDAALWFRELMPGTLLSAGHMLAAAVAARALHRRDPSQRRWYESFWGLSAALLAGLAAVELAQPTVFLSHWLRDAHAVRAPEGISDVDGLLVTLLLAGVVATLAPRALVLLRYPRALALFGGAALLAATSQFIDATARVSEWEFVVEDGAKALAGPFLLAGYLAALHACERRRAG
ncbi:MAG: hypothetical protein ACRDNB_03305 [Gaiellaceae bacterium]